MNGRRMDPRQHSRVMMQQQALMRSQLAQAATMPPEPLNSYVLSWHGHGGGPQHGGRGGGGGPGPIPSLSSGQGFYTVESLQGATAMPIPHNGPGLLGMGGPMLQPGFDSHHQLPVIMHPMLGHKVLANGMGFPQGGAAGGGMVRMPGPEPPHMFGNAPPPHHLFVQNRLPQGYPHARRDVGPMFFSRERERDRVRVRDRDRDRDRERSRDRGRVRDRERERDRERDRERVRDRDRDRERERGRERDRDRDQDRESRQVEQKFHTRSKKGRVKQASPPLNPESPVPKPPNSSGKAKRKQPSALGPGGPGWCSLCQVECNTEEMLEQHVAGKRHKRHLQKLDGDQEGAKKKQYSSEIKLGDDLAGDTHLVVHEGSNLVKKGSTDDGGGEEQTAKKPRLEDSESEIGTLDLSSTMEMEQSSKLNEVCSRLDGEYVDDVEEPVEDDVDNSASLTNIQAIGGSAEFLVSNCGQQDSTEDVSSGVGKILDDPSVAALLQDVNEKPACNHTEVARWSFAERLSTGDCIENPPAVGGKEGSGDESRGPAAETLLTVEDHNAVNAVAETVEGFHQTGEKLVQQGGMVDLAAIHAL